MIDDLLPPEAEIHKRLTIIAREQKRLRILLAIVRETKHDAEQFGTITQAKDKPTPTPKG